MKVMDKITEAKIQKGWDDMVAGRVSPANEVFDRIEARHKNDHLRYSYDRSSRN